MQSNNLEKIHVLTYIILLVLTLLTSVASVNGITYTEMTEDNIVELSLNTDDFYLDTITNVNLQIKGKDETLTEHVPLDIILLTDTSGSMTQSGWYLTEKPDPSESFTITIPNGDWSDDVSFSVPAGVKRVAAELTWTGDPDIDGSESSELVLNLFDGEEWYFNSAGDADYYVDEHYSGKTTKPQILMLDNPNSTNKTEWKFSVNGRYFRPRYGAPDTLDGEVTIYFDYEDSDSDNLEKSETILAYDAANDALQSFIGQLDETDRVSLVSFSSNIKASYPLTYDHNSILDAVDREISKDEIGGGTDIAEAIYFIEDLFSNKRDEAVPIAILLTDGQNDDGSTPVIAASEYVKDFGYNIISIGLTNFVNTELLKEVSYPSKSYSAVTNDVLNTVYDSISEEITSLVAKETALEFYVDERFNVSENIIVDNHTYATEIQNNIITLDLGPLSSVETKQITITLTPTEIGNYTIGNNSKVSYTSIQNNEEELLLPTIDFNIYYAPCDERNPARDDVTCDWNKDFDNDGIINGEDQCSETPDGEGVDDEGCSCSQKQDLIDDDNVCTDDSCEDGIISHANNNYIYPTYISCPSSSCNGELFYAYIDGGYDSCMDGSVVTFSCEATITYDNTCDTDDDDDGIEDVDDLCADTPDTEGADAQGCSCSQKADQIDDGNPCTSDGCINGDIHYVFNSITVGDMITCQESYCNGTTYYSYETGGYDTCSNGTITPYSCIPTIIEDADECAYNKPKDSDSDGVLDENDLCSETPAYETVNSDGCSCTDLASSIKYNTCPSDKCSGTSYYDYPHSGYDSCKDGLITKYSCEPDITSRSPKCKSGGGNGGGSSGGSSGGSGEYDTLLHKIEVTTLEPPFYLLPTLTGSIEIDNKGDFNEKDFVYEIYGIVNGSTAEKLFAKEVSEILSPNESLAIVYEIIIQENVSYEGLHYELSNSKVEKMWDEQIKISNPELEDNANGSDDSEEESLEELDENQEDDSDDSDDGRTSSGGSGSLYGKPIIPVVEVQNDQESENSQGSSLGNFIEKRKDEFNLDNAVHVPLIIAGTAVVVTLYGANNLLSLLRKRFLK